MSNCGPIVSGIEPSASEADSSLLGTGILTCLHLKLLGILGNFFVKHSMLVSFLDSQLMSAIVNFRQIK